MKISFWIPAIVFCVARIVITDSIQVGTVLFTASDLVKSCWVDKDKSLLKARLIMQDVLPDPRYIDFSKPDSVMTLVDYFYSCYETIRNSTSGNIQNLMLAALSDSIGGYLRGYVLPLTKKAYYAGQVNYLEAKRLFQMYDDIKCYLRTNGLGWTEPQKVKEQGFRPRPLSISERGGKKACRSLYTIEQKQVFPTNPKVKTMKLYTGRKDNWAYSPTENQHHFRAKSSREYKKIEPDIAENQNYTLYLKPNATNMDWNMRQVPRNTLGEIGDLKKRLKEYYEWTMNEKACRDRNDDLEDSANDFDMNSIREKIGRAKRLWGLKKNKDPISGSPENTIMIPLPLLDDPKNPHAIAVPFKTQPLRNLQTQGSAFVLEHYYSSAIKCLASKSHNKRDITNFNSDFYTWLVSEVCPHLGDEQWYPGFGGVLRVLETIKKFRAKEMTSRNAEANDFSFMFPQGVKFYEKRKTRPRGIHRTRQVKNEAQNEEQKPRKYFIFSILVISTFGILLLCACIFCVLQTIRTMGSKGESIPRKRSNRMMFEYVISFFKKSEDNEPKCPEPSPSDMSQDRFGSKYIETGRHNVWVGRAETPKTRLSIKDKSTKDDQKEKTVKEKKKTEPKHKNQGQVVVVGEGQGDAAAFATSYPDTSPPDSAAKPGRLRRTSLLRLDKMGLGVDASAADKAAGDAPVKKPRPVKESEKVETLWKIPSARFAKNARKEVCTSNSKTKDSLESSRTRKPITGSDSLTASAEDGRKGYSTENRSSSYGLSGSGSQSRVTTTYSSSQTQVEDKFSSATMEFLEKVIGKHKPFAKSSTQETTAESETDGEGSYSSETDY